MMKKISTLFPEVFIIEPDVFKDKRGFFFESYSYKKYSELGFMTNFLQGNHTRSKRNTVRGLHFSLLPGQIKLIRCSLGRIWDVVVDIRPNSENFKKWYGCELTSENFLQLYIPVGFAHGYSVLSDIAEVQYKVDNYYDPSLEKEVYWNDPTIAIDWKVDNAIISNRDVNAPNLDDYLKEHPDPFR